MADKEKTDDKVPDGPITMGTIRELVADTVKAAVSGLTSIGSDTTKPDTKNSDSDTKGSGLDIAGQVQRELDKLKAREAQDAREKSIDEKLAELSEKTKEKPPVERRRVHNFMGWGE